MVQDAVCAWCGGYAESGFVVAGGSPGAIVWRPQKEPKRSRLQRMFGGGYYEHLVPAPHSRRAEAPALRCTECRLVWFHYPPPS